LADEINRAPAKVQSIRSDAGKQVTMVILLLNRQTFLSIGNSKPIEQEGTYQLQAQVDRFMLKTVILPNG
jgi:MoxR-like ATPase